jgi:predicted ATPase
LVLPTQDPTYHALAERLASLDTDEETLMELGQLLFAALFQGAIRDVYVRTQGMLGADEGMRLRLNIAATEGAAIAMPWEFLYDPDQGPLALLDAPVMRYLPQSARIPTFQAELPLKVLLTGAYTPPAPDVERELNDVAAALSGMGEHVQIIVEPHLTTAKLQQLLRQSFHIWHFVGHGGFARDGTTGRLMFEDARGDSEAVSAMQLGILLNRSGLRLVVLDACEGGRLALDPFRSVAPALVRAQIPAVVAMQFTVPQEAARSFSSELYRALAEGFPIDACVTEGRKAVMNATGLRNPDWGIPVVYTRAPDGHLFARPTADRPPAAKAEQVAIAPARQPEPRAERAAATADEAPPPDHRLINLPAMQLPLVGRNQDVAAARTLLQNTNVRLLTLTGPGGAGKTRLAIQIASGMADFYEHGVCFVDLAPIGQRDLVLSTIAHTLGVREESDESLIETLYDYLRQRQILLVLDNFEQVIEAGPLLAEALATLPRLQILVTSRAALRVSGEYEFPVEPLALPNLKRLPPLAELAQNPAVALFVDRARAVKASFTLNQSNARTVAEICARLDGLPLAIELAAARCNVLTPQALLARLNNRLDLLTGGARDMAARQQTLRGAIAWSYDLLNDAERVLFARLAVFVGGCTLEAAETVCGTVHVNQGRILGGLAAGLRDDQAPIAVLDTLGSLVDKSLVRQVEAHGDARFKMLETIREYAQLRLATSGETAPLRRQHAVYYIDLAEQAEPELSGPQQTKWLEQLENEHDNFRAALGWALQAGEPEQTLRLGAALGRFWFAHGHLSEGRHWLELALLGAPPPDRDPPAPNAPLNAATQSHLTVRAKALNAAGNLASTQGDYTRAQAYYVENLEISRLLGDHFSIARALNSLGVELMIQEDFAQAKGYFEEALALFRGLKDDLRMAHILNNLGQVATNQDDIPQAQRHYTESLKIFRALEDTNNIGMMLLNLGGIALLRQDYRQARRLYLESLKFMREMGDRETIAYCLEGLAAVAAPQQPERAARLWGAAEALRELVGAPLWPADRLALDRTVAQTRARIDTASFTTAWEAGRELQLEQAIDLALSEGSGATDPALRAGDLGRLLATTMLPIASPVARLILSTPNGERVIVLDHMPMTVGRGSNNDIVLTDPRISRKHARLSYREEQIWVADTGSSNGTFVNGEQVAERALRDGDNLSFGGLEAQFKN